MTNRISILTVALVSAVLFFAVPCRAASYHVITVSDAIGPAVAEFVQTGIREAEQQDSRCLIVRLDTPGGLVGSMRDIVMAILASRIPIVVYVTPSGARAASAGVMITMAADVAVMTPGTNIGAAHPVGGGVDSSETMSKKVVNDMVAHARSVAERRGRNADWVEEAIRESVSVTETEALEKKVIDLVADNMEDLVAKLDGRKIEGKGVLDLKDAERIEIAESLRTRILRTISNPNVAFILFMIGLAGLYFELSNPGAIFPGVIGGIALILAFFAFQALPVNTVGILLILLAIVLFILEIKVTSYGLLSLGGVLCLSLGSLMLFDDVDPTFRLSWQVMASTVILVSGFFLALIWLVLKAQVSKARTGMTGLVGEVGIVKQALSPDGKILIRGELWKASSAAPLAVGEPAKVIAVEGLTLRVEPADRA